MCGEMAGDKNAIPLLVGLGLDEFSMSATSVLASRRLISEINFKSAKHHVDKILDLETEQEVLDYLKQANFK